MHDTGGEKRLRRCRHHIHGGRQTVVLSLPFAAAMRKDRRYICIHGSAGCGKTTAFQEIRDLLPQGSPMLVLDCYGAGKPGSNPAAWIRANAAESDAAHREWNQALWSIPPERTIPPEAQLQRAISGPSHQAALRVLASGGTFRPGLRKTIRAVAASANNQRE